MSLSGLGVWIREEQLLGSTAYAHGAAVGLKAAFEAAVALAAVADGDGVAEFAGKAVMAVYHLSVDDYAAADTGSEGDHDEVLHPACHAVGHLTHRRSVGVVGDSHRKARKALYQGCQVDHRRLAFVVVAPFQVGSILHRTLIIVAVGGADTDALHLADFGGFGYDALDRLGQFVDVVDEFVLQGGDDGLGDDFALFVDDAEFGALTADVDSDY